MLRKIALNLIKQHSTAKISLKARRKKTAWDELVSMLSDTVPFPARWKGNGSSLERDDGCRF
jgi:hypothetical protein